MSETTGHLDPDVSLGYQVRRCHRHFDRLLNGYLGPHGVSSGFWYYLRVLWMKDGLTQKRLSQEINVMENSTTATIAAMARRGLVERLRDKLDRRKIRITLTEEGRRLEQDLISTATRINEIAVAGIAPRDVAICLAVLRRAAKNLERDAASN